MLSNILKKFRPLEFQDEFFGRLIYMKAPKGRISYWEARRVFASTGREIELFIDAPSHEQPPHQVQREFFSAVESRFKEILAATETVLRPQFEEWARQPLSEPFELEFTMTSFSIPYTTLDQATWEASFELKTDANHLFTVALRGLVATGVSIDG